MRIIKSIEREGREEYWKYVTDIKYIFELY